MVEPLISVVIPTLDRQELAEGAIKNVLDQSYDNLEVIVVEDGSTSTVDEFISGLGDNRVIYASHETNRGLGATRNTGMSLAKGEYIAFLDDDDRWLENKIRLQVDIMKKCGNNKTMVYCFNTQKQGQKLHYQHCEPARGQMSDHIFRGRLLPSSSMMINRSSLISLRGHSEELISCVDHDMWMKLAINGFDMDLVEEGFI